MALAILWGCTQEAAPPTQASTPAKAPQKAPAIAAKVNGQVISMARFNSELASLTNRYQRAQHEVKPPLKERLKDSVVRRLVDDVLIAQKAEQLGAGYSQEEIDRKFEDYKRRYGSPENLRSHLERVGSSEENLRRSFEALSLREALTQRLAEDITVSGEEIRGYYEKNIARYRSEEMVRASQILIRVSDNAEPAVLKQKQALARKVRSLASKRGADFAALAREYGEDPSKSRGGDLGFFARGRMVKAVEDAVWKLKVGRLVRRPIKTQYGFHILKKTGHRKEKTEPFESVSEKIEQGLTTQKRNRAVQEALEKWRLSSTIEIFVRGDAKTIDTAYRDQNAKPPFMKEAKTSSSTP